MNKEAYLKIITSALSALSFEVEYRNSINLYDINIIAEDFFKDFLNMLYGYNLINFNILDKNTAAIDLGDTNARIAIQVTSDNSSTKIDKTLKKFIEKKLYNQYDRLLFLLLTKKKKYTKTFDTQGKFTFDKKFDIIDNNDLIQHINCKDTDQLFQISNFLNKEILLNVDRERRRQANEVETIIDLVEYLSKNKSKPKDNNNSITDPEQKINRRFKKYAEFLNNIYISLVSVYSEAVKLAKNELGIDEVKSFLIGVYLKDVSNNFLEKANGNPKEALENLTIYFKEQLSVSGKEYDVMAIKFYLISETIKCNVFPMEGEKNESFSTR